MVKTPEPFLFTPGDLICSPGTSNDYEYVEVIEPPDMERDPWTFRGRPFGGREDGLVVTYWVSPRWAISELWKWMRW